MLDRDDILRRLRQHEAALRQKGVSALFLFGSVARNEAGADSDVDLFFDCERARFSLLDVIGVQHYLADELALRIDAMTRGSLHPALRTDIEQSAVRVF